ncbi:MAG: hypothetical protein FJW35_10450, partial [Acidobacteria bacterium]|nr:hypothetical protein [Acidobacteriota bacterium]
MINMALVRFVAVLIAVTASAPAASYWQELSVITGKVSDARGIPIPSAAVRLALREGGASRETLTVEDGTFRFDAVPAGTYRLVIEMQGFQRFVLESFDIAGEMARELSLTMQSPAPSRPEPGQARPGAAAGPPGARGAMNPPSFPEVSPVDVSPTGEVQGGLPGVDALQAGAAAGGADVLVVAGNPGLTLDAMDWNDPRMRERMMDGARRMGFMINEVRAQGPGSGMGGMGFGGGGPMGGGRPVFGGGFGPGAGGRGGRMSQPKINGAVDFRYANSALNARPYSLTGEELTAPLQIQNNFGFTVGGVLPGAAPAAGRRGPGGGRGGGWFFNYSGSRNRSPFDVLTTVPTELERRGDFSQTLMRSGMSAGTPVVIYDPATPGAALFENARIPPSRIDAASSALLKYIPLPNLPGSVQNFTMQRGLVDSNDQLGLRINTALGSGNNMNFSYSHRRGGSVSSGIFPGLDSERSNRAHNAMVGGMYRIQQRLLFNYRVSFNRVRNLSSNDFAFEDDVAGKLGITGISGDPINYGIPGIRLTNYGDLSLGSPALNQNQTLTMAGSMMKIGTRHNIRTGLDLAWSRRNIQTDRNPRGTFDFTGFATSAFDAHGRPIAGTGYDFADFLLGHPYASSRQYGSGRSYLRGKSINVFFQDDWRVNARFTINYGVRYEYVQPFYEKNDRMVNLDVAPG